MTTLYTLFLKPASSNEDTQRREFILNILLLGSLVLSAAALILKLFSLHTDPNPTEATGTLGAICVTLLIFVLLSILSRRGLSNIAAYIFVTLYILLTSYILFHWGILLPEGILLSSMIIVLAGVLVGTRFAFWTMMVLGLILFILAWLQTSGAISLDRTWQNEIGNVFDALAFIFTLGIITLVSWLSNREIERSLQRARRSEAALQKERDFLELRVQERTQDLKREQLEKISQLYRFAEIGQFTAGIIHDLANPLSAVSFSLEQIGGKDRSKLVERALKSTEYMKRFIENARKQMQHQENLTNYSLVTEMRSVIQIVSYRAKKQNVEIVFQPKGDFETYGNAAKVDQVVANLMSNAIDAYANLPDQKDHERTITLTLAQEKKQIIIEVIDQAGGIPLDLQPKIFEPFVTTKGPEKGTGIGLSMCKRVAEKDLGGKLTFKSEVGKGTVFSLVFPIQAAPAVSHG